MNVFDLRDRLVADYASYTRSFIKIRDPRIIEHGGPSAGCRRVLARTAAPAQPDVPAGRHDRRPGGAGTLHPECARIFRIDKSDTDHTGKQLLPAHASARGDPQGQGGQVLRPDQRHRLGQEPDLHRPDRRPRSAQRVGPGHPGHRRLSDERPGQQPGRRTRGSSSRRAIREGQSPVRFARYTGQEKGR